MMGKFDTPKQWYSSDSNREPETFVNLERALIEADKRVFQFAPDLDSFCDVKPVHVIQAHKNLIIDMEKKFKESANTNSVTERVNLRLAKVFEAMVLHNIDGSNWFGEHTNVLPTTRYDDIFNHIDGLLEFRPNVGSYGYLSLAIDVTSTGYPEKKFATIRKGIESGKLAHIEYFESERNGIKGKINRIPMSVVGADRQTIKEMMDPWVAKNNALTHHPVQFQLLIQIREQMAVYAKYAKEVTHNPDIIDIFEQNLAIVSDILEQRKQVYGSEYASKIRAIEKDKVHQRIMELLRNGGWRY